MNEKRLNMARQKTEPTHSENKLATSLKGKINKTSDKQLKYAADYNSQFDSLRIRVQAGEADVIKKYAAANGWQSLNKMVQQAIDYVMVQGLTAEQVQAVIRSGGAAEKWNKDFIREKESD